jgi:LmbE family N-acetylglucosaminyl deacetylase
VKTPAVLAIGAHPDDIVLGVGGFLAGLTAAGRHVVMLTLTSGELGGDPAVREEEEKLAAMRLGASVTFGRIADGCVTENDAFRLVERALAEHRPTAVFVHDANDTHCDHANTARATIAAARAVPNLFFYEGPSTIAFAPQASVDVAGTWRCKLDAIATYESQAMRRLDTWADGAARFRAWPRNAGGMSEAFRVAHADLGAAMTGGIEIAFAEPALAAALRG